MRMLSISVAAAGVTSILFFAPSLYFLALKLYNFAAKEEVRETKLSTDVATGYSGLLFSTQFEFFYPSEQHAIISDSIISLLLRICFIFRNILVEIQCFTWGYKEVKIPNKCATRHIFIGLYFCFPSYVIINYTVDF